MRILFDQGAPVQLVPLLPEHEITEASVAGLDKVPDGTLLLAAENAGFDVLLTNDRNMTHQQNLRGRRIAVVVLRNSRWPIVRRYVRRINSALHAAKPGTFKEVDIPRY